jgi:hypothetical protein
MKIKKIKDPLTYDHEKVDFEDSQLEITERKGGVHLLVVAIDPAIPMWIKSATYNFANRKKGLKVFHHILSATARNAH